MQHIKNKALALIAAGNSQTEYYLIYAEAIKLLVDNFTAETHQEISAFFEKHIPEPKEFTALKPYCKSLYSKDEGERIKASKYFSKIATAQKSGFIEFPFNYPKYFELLFPALEDDNEKVVANIIIALGASCWHYTDYRVLKKLQAFYYAKSSTLRYYALIWTESLTHKNRDYDFLIKYIQEKQSLKVIEAISIHFSAKSKYREQVPTHILHQILPIFIAKAKKKTSIQRGLIIKIIKLLGDLERSEIEPYLDLLDFGNEKEVKAIFKEFIEIYLYKDSDAYNVFTKELQK